MRWFASVRASVERWQTMRELRGLQKRENRGAYWEFKNLITEAHEVFERDLRARAVEIWQRAYMMFPEAAMQSQPALDLLMKLKLFDEAELLLQRSRKRFPGDVQVLEGLAQVANSRGDHEEALRRCDVLRKPAPASVRGYGIAAASLSELGRAEEAESLLGRALKAMPEDAGLRIEYARLADRRSDWETALERWTEVLEVCGHLSGAVGMAAALSKLGHYDEAEQVLSGVTHKAGNQIAIWIEYAHIAEHRNDQVEAVKRWQTVRDRFPLHPVGYLHGLRGLVAAGRQDEAEAILRDGIERLPGDAELAVEYASVAHRRGDWTEAAERWLKVRERFPGERQGYGRGAEALEALGEGVEAGRVRVLAPVPR